MNKLNAERAKITYKGVYLLTFMDIYTKYKNNKLNGNEEFNFKLNLDLLGKENATLEEMITDNNFLKKFYDKWKNNFIYYPFFDENNYKDNKDKAGK